MSEKTVKIEYQFVGEDVGLTTKIDDIYKKLDKLGEGASVVIKKIDGLNTETITLTNTLNTATGKLEVFSSEMRELQSEADKATKEVNELINALNKLNATKSNGAINNQKQLNNLLADTSKSMENIASLQNKIGKIRVNFEGTPKLKQLENQLNSVSNQLQEANKLSNQLSNKTYKVNSGTSIADIKNTKANTKAIQQETKAIQQQTKAIQEQQKARKIINTGIKEAPFSERNRTDDMSPHRLSKNSLERTKRSYEVSLGVNGLKEALDYAPQLAKQNKHFEKVYKDYREKVDTYTASKEKGKELGTAEMLRISDEAVKAQNDMLYSMKALDWNNTSSSKKRKSVKQIQQETKAIEENTRAKIKSGKIEYKPGINSPRGIIQAEKEVEESYNKKDYPIVSINSKQINKELMGDNYLNEVRKIKTLATDNEKAYIKEAKDVYESLKDGYLSRNKDDMYKYSKAYIEYAKRRADIVDRINGTNETFGSSDENHKKNTSTIQAETKAIEQNTKAQQSNQEIAKGFTFKRRTELFYSQDSSKKQLYKELQRAEWDLDFNKSRLQEKISELNDYIQEDSNSPHIDTLKNLVSSYSKKIDELQNSIYDIKAKALKEMGYVDNTQDINKETKAIEENTKARVNNRKITNANVKQSPFSGQTGRITSDIKAITQAFNEGKKLNTSSDFAGTDLEVAGKTIAGMYRSTNKQVKQLLGQYQKEVAKRDNLLKTLPISDNKLGNKLEQLNQYKNKIQAINNASADVEHTYKATDGSSISESSNNLKGLIKAYKKLNKEVSSSSNSQQKKLNANTDEYIKQAIETQKVLKDIDDVMNKTNTNKTFGISDRNYKKNTTLIQEETKAIEENTQAQKKNYQVLGDLSKLKGKPLTREINAPQTQEQAQTIGRIASEINNKAVQLQQALNNNDATLIKSLSNEIKTLQTQRQALEKLQGKTLANTTNTKYQGKITQPNNIVSANVSNVKAIDDSSNAMLEAAKLNNETAKLNNQYVDKQLRYQKGEEKVQQQKTQGTIDRAKIIEDSNNRRYEAGKEYANQKRQDSANFKEQQAYKKALKQAPNELKNLTNTYKGVAAQVKEENLKMSELQDKIKKAVSKGALKEDDFKSIEKTFAGQQKRIANATTKIGKLNQKTDEVLEVIGKDALRISKSTKNMKSGTQSYRVSGNQTIGGKVGDIGKVNQYKKAVSDLTQAQKELDKEMMNLSKNSIIAGNSLLKAKNSIGSLGNITQIAGKGIMSLGTNIQNLGKGMMNMGQNIQMVANSLRTLSLVATSVFAYVGTQGIEFNRSLQGVASALDRIEVNADGTVSIMSDFEFDNTIEEMSKTAREQARSSIYDANQIMEAYRATTLAGWSSAETMESMPALINMATASRIDGNNFSGLIDDVANSLASLGMVYEGIDIDGDGVFDERIRKDADDMAESITRLTDVMSKAQAISTLDVDELVESYKKGGSQLSSFGLSLEEITTMFSVLGNRGIKGTAAATGMSSLMANLTGKTGQAKKALDEIYEKTGVDVYAWNSKGQYVGLEEHLNRLSKAFKELKKMYGSEYGVDNLQLAQLLGGKHHFKSLTKLLEGYDSGEFNEILITLQNSQGTTASMAEQVEKSTWAELKITLSEVKEAALSLWDVIEPIFTEILKVIQDVAKAFTQLSDEEKLNIAKMGAMLIIGTTLLSFFSMFLIIIGSAISMIGSLVLGFGKLIFVIGGVISALAGATGITSFITTLMPALGPVITALTTVLTKLKAIGLVKFAGIGLSIVGLVKSFLMLKDAVVDAWKQSDSFGEFLLRSFMNMGDQFQHFLFGILDKVDAFFSKFGISIKKGLANAVKGLADFFGYETKDISEEELFTSDLDKKAQAQGYDNYEDYKKGRTAGTIGDFATNALSKITSTITGVDVDTGAFKATIAKLQKAIDGEEGLTLTVEDLKTDSSSFAVLKKTIENQLNDIETTKVNIEIDEEKVYKYNKQLKKLKDDLANTTDKNKKKQIQKEIDNITKQRDAQLNLKLTNEEKLAELEESYNELKDKEITITTTYKEAGLEEELNYEANKQDFENNHGSKLSYADYNQDKMNAEDLKQGLPAIRQELETKLKYTTNPDDYNKIYFMLEKVKEMEINIPTYLELINEQKIINDADSKIEKANKIITEKSEEQRKILEKTGLTAEELTGSHKTAFDNASKEIQDANTDIKKYQDNIDNAKDKISNLGDLTGVYDLWEDLYENYNQPLLKLFSDEEMAILGQIQKGLDTTYETKTVPEKEEPKTQTEEQVWTPRKIEEKTEGQSGPRNINRKENFNNSLNRLYYGSSVLDNSNNNKEITKENNSNTTENTKTKQENTQATQENTEAIQNNNETNTQNTETKKTETNTDFTETLNKTKEIASSISSMNLDSLSETMSIVYTFMQETRNALLSVCNVAANRGKSTLTDMGTSLTTALDGARSKLLSICNVAVNRGTSAMRTMGQALTNAISGASSTVSGIASQINSIKNTANSITIPTPSSVNITPTTLSPMAYSGAMRSITNNNTSNSTLNTSNFNFNMNGVLSNNRKDIKDTAKQLAIYCKRRGL